jgi:hypothetical protein
MEHLSKETGVKSAKCDELESAIGKLEEQARNLYGRHLNFVF